MAPWMKRELSRSLRSAAKAKQRPISLRCRLAVEELESRITPSLSYTLNLVNSTGLPGANNLQVVGYSDNGLSLTKGGLYKAYGSATSLSSFPLTDLPGGKVTLNTDIISGRIVVSYGPSFSLTISGGKVLGPTPALTPFTNQPYDFVEFTLNEGGTNPGLFINTSQVDQLGFPITVTGPPVAGGPGQSVGVTPGVTRTQLIQSFQDYVNAKPGGSAFASLVTGPANQPNRIVSPSKVTTSPYPFATYMNGPLQQLFENPGANLVVQSSVQNTGQFVAYQGQAVQWQYAGGNNVMYRSLPTPGNPNPTPTTVTLPTLASGYTYNYQASDETTWFNALMFKPTTTQTGEFAGPYFVFEPFWQANTSVQATNLSIASNVATITTNQLNGVQGGSTVNISSSSSALLPNGSYKVTNVLNSNQFQISLTQPDTPTFTYSANVSLGDSAIPSWIAAAQQAAITPGEMVFAGNGVFADQGATSGPNYTPGQIKGTDVQNTYQLILANLENQLDSSLNRGVANVDYTTQTSPPLTITNVAFGVDSANFPQAIITTSAPVTFAPSIGENITMANVPMVGGFNLNGTYSPTGSLGAFQFSVALPPGAPTTGSFTASGTVQLVQNGGLNPGKYLNSTWLWNDSSKYYTTGVNDNLYADALHNLKVNGQPAFINQQVYALSYDDQGGHSPSLFFGPSFSGKTVTATLDPWFTSIGSANSWQGTSLGGQVTQIASALDSSDDLELFGIGGDHALWINTQTSPGGAFSGWSSLGGYVKQITVATQANGLLAVFAIGGDNAAYLITQNGNGTWTPGAYTDLGGYVQQLTTGLDLNGQLELFGIGGDNAVWYDVQTSGTSFGGWNSLGGYVKQITVGTNADGTLQVFGVGGDNAAWYRKQDSTGNLSFDSWTSLGGYVTQLATGLDLNGHLELFGIGGDNAIWTRAQTDSTGVNFSAWNSLGGYVTQISVTSDLGDLAVFGIGGDSAIWYRKQNAANNLTFDPYVRVAASIAQLSAVTDENGSAAVFAIGKAFSDGQFFDQA